MKQVCWHLMRGRVTDESQDGDGAAAETQSSVTWQTDTSIHWQFTVGPKWSENSTLCWDADPRRALTSSMCALLQCCTASRQRCTVFDTDTVRRVHRIKLSCIALAAVWSRLASWFTVRRLSACTWPGIVPRRTSIKKSWFDFRSERGCIMTAASCSHLSVPVIKHYNLVLVKQLGR